MAVKRYRIKFFGIVQGVGFRPFIFRTATYFNLSGFVKNLSNCVVVEIEGEADNIEKFLKKVNFTPPPLLKIEKIEKKEIKLKGENSFNILKSDKKTKLKVHISPDIAICNDCFRELFDQNNRRYRYPFINCTNCGPRLTIINDIPYDRANTSMAKFQMCEKCKEEYENPFNRRFHAEPIACEQCGPSLFLIDNKGKEIKSNNLIKECITLLKQGDIVAIKGLGGFHLAVDATNSIAVESLRLRKKRKEKPFAIMVKNLHYAEQIAYLSEKEQKMLTSYQSPILLVKKKENLIIANNVAPGISNFGIMLPYTPLHCLLLEEIPYLVMTSGNISNEPICIDNKEAFSRLKNIADYFLINNRDILVRCDDSIGAIYNGKMQVFRRSRGYAPAPVKLVDNFEPVLALGGFLKNTVCIIRENFAFLSPHVGDLETPLSREFFKESINLLLKITETNPKIIAVDMHPHYYSTQFAKEFFKEKQIFYVQHHHAHIVSCMAENMIKGKVVGIALDGTGYGTDGTVWGGEVLVCTEKDFKRVGFIKNFLLLGGEKAVYEVWRIALSFLIEVFADKWEYFAEKLNIFPKNIKNKKIFSQIWQKNINSIYTSSAGRLFDAVAAVLLGIKKVEYEAEAAIKLEAISSIEKYEILPYEIKNYQINFEKTFKEIVIRYINGENIGFLGKSFHMTFVEAFFNLTKKICKKENINKVVLSGGCFQNKIIFENFYQYLIKEDLIPYFHKEIPVNDGGISLGQAVIAGYNCQ